MYSRIFRCISFMSSVFCWGILYSLGVVSEKISKLRFEFHVKQVLAIRKNTFTKEPFQTLTLVGLLCSKGKYRAYTKEWCGFKNCDWRLIFGHVGKLVVTPTEYQLRRLHSTTGRSSPPHVVPA
jgi:hypothetical protein